MKSERSNHGNKHREFRNKDTSFLGTMKTIGKPLNRRVT